MSEARFYREQAAMSRAQAAYDNMSPPEDGPSQCDVCDGKGEQPDPADEEAVRIKCLACDGFGWVDEGGNPFDPKAAERAQAEAADERFQRMRDEGF